LRRDERGAVRARNETDGLQSISRRTLYRLEAGARRRAFGEQRLAGLDLQRREQRAHDGAEIQHIGARGLQRQVRRHGVQLRSLHEQKLLVTAGVGFIALDRKACVHRIARGERGEQITLAGIHGDQIADLQSPLALHFTAERGDQRDAARARDLIVEIVVFERRHRNASDRPDVVEVDLGGEHVDHGLVRARRWHGHENLALEVFRQAMGGRTGGGIADHGVTVLPGRDWREPRKERRTDRQQFTARDQLRHLIWCGRGVAAHR
jgi:hypothetical protein